MECLLVGGGRPLSGTVEISGAKNAALPILAATVLCSGTCIVHRCPEIADVKIASQIICTLGGQVQRCGQTLFVNTATLTGWEIPAVLMRQMRASVLFLGALLARFGKAVLTLPGGCPLGERPVDLHLQALTQMGASVCFDGERICCEAPQLRGGVITLPFPSVGATENILLAAAGCGQSVELRGAAQEPEVRDLCGFLRSMGTELEMRGDVVSLTGGCLHETEYTILPDRIETATYLCAAAACGGDVTTCCTDGTLLLPVLERLEQAGCSIDLDAERVHIAREAALRGIGTVETAPYPGFPTDAQALLMAAMLRAEGESRFCELVFPGRFFHVPELRRFGADIVQQGASATVRGVGTLKGAAVTGTDLRATAALILAALQVNGNSKIFGLKHLYRGYYNLVENFKKLGAEIKTEGCNNTTGNFAGNRV